MDIPGLAITSTVGVATAPGSSTAPVGPPADPKPGYFMFDDFSVSPDDTLRNRVPNVKSNGGNTWQSPVDGEFTITNGTLRSTSVNGRVSYDIGVNNNYQVEMISVSDNVKDIFLAVLVGYIDDDNYTEFRWDFNRQRAFCRRRSGGSWNFVGINGDFTFGTGDLLKARVVDGKILYYVGPEYKGEFTVGGTHLQQSTKTGLGSYDNEPLDPLVSSFGVQDKS